MSLTPLEEELCEACDYLLVALHPSATRYGIGLATKKGIKAIKHAEEKEKL